MRSWFYFALVSTSCVLHVESEFCSLEDQVCSHPLEPDSFDLTRIEGRAVTRFNHPGWKAKVILEDDRVVIRKTLSLSPLLFEVEDFLSGAECDHIIQIAQSRGLKQGETGRSMQAPLNGFQIYDFDHDDKIDVSEMRLMLQHNYDVFFQPEDIQKMYDDLGLDLNEDGKISKNELDEAGLTVLSWKEYIEHITSNKPWLRDRHSDITWLQPENADPTVGSIVRRIAKLIQLPMEMMNRSDIQIAYYTKSGHYNIHLDSTNEEKHCCSRHWPNPNCYPCRWMTVMFYLNDVAQGGETAFPFANDELYDNDDFERKHYYDLTQHCDKSTFRVKPKKGKAVFWYNHLPNLRNGWFGEVDEASRHGGCPVLKGEKWIANIWVSVVHDKPWNLSPLGTPHS